MTLSALLNRIAPADQAAMAAARIRWDSVAKPLGSLGILEDHIVRIAGAQGTPDVSLARKAVVAMCADNGVVAQGVTQTGQEVTAIVAENMARGASSVCRMARIAGADVVPVDIGVARPVSGHRLLQRNIRRGTANMARGPAMTREEATQAVLTGLELARELAGRGYTLLATGEMGIGNTTTASAVASVLLDRPPAEVTGRGAGLSDEGLSRPDPADPLDVLAKVGGLDLAGLAGVFLGGAVCRVPVLVDGFISAVAALIARRICPDAAGYLLGSHASAEPAGRMVMEALELKPFLYAGMRLGEGTGAVAVMPLLDMGLAVYREMSTFDEIEIEAYQPLGG